MRILFISFLFFALAACEKTIEIDIPRKDPKLVINANLENGELVSVMVGKSRHVLDPEDHSGSNLEPYIVKDATVIVYENNTAIDTLVFDAQNYIYRSSEYVKPGFTYTVKAFAPGFGAAEATSIVPSQSVIREVTRIKNARTSPGNVQQDEVIIKFDDPGNETNFYKIAIHGAWGPVYCVSTTDKDVEPIGENADPFSTDNCYDGESLLLKDVNFNGKEKTVRFFVDSYDLQEYTDPNGVVRKPFIVLYRITEDHFKFVKSYHVHYNTSDNPFAEPSNVFSNVKNGYGSFSIYTLDMQTL